MGPSLEVSRARGPILCLLLPFQSARFLWRILPPSAPPDSFDSLHSYSFLFSLSTLILFLLPTLYSLSFYFPSSSFSQVSRSSFSSPPSSYLSSISSISSSSLSFTFPIVASVPLIRFSSLFSLLDFPSLAPCRFEALPFLINKCLIQLYHRYYLSCLLFPAVT